MQTEPTAGVSIFVSYAHQDQTLQQELKEYTSMVLAGDTYAYGFVHVLEGMRLVGHSGGFPGVSTRFDLYPETGYTVVVLSNYDPPIADQLASTVRDMLLQMK